MCKRFAESEDLLTISEFKTKAWQNDQAAADYHKNTVGASTAFQLVRQTIFLDIIAEFIPAASRILDLGCGTGLLSNALFDLGFFVVGSDVSLQMLEVLVASRGVRNYETRIGTGLSIPARDHEFDAVVSRMFMQHFPDWPNILREKARVTRPGGIVLFDFGNQEHVDKVRRKLNSNTPTPYSDDPEAGASAFYATSCSANMKSQALACGLEILKIIPHGLFLNNYNFWLAKGPAGVTAFNRRLDQLLVSEEARELFLEIERSFVSTLPCDATYGNIVVARRLANDDEMAPSRAV